MEWPLLLHELSAMRHLRRPRTLLLKISKRHFCTHPKASRSLWIALSPLFSSPDQSISKYSSILVPASIKIRRRSRDFFSDVTNSRSFPAPTTPGGTTCGSGSHRISRIVLLILTSSCPNQGGSVASSRVTILNNNDQSISYIAVVFRHPHEQFRQYAELIPGITVRLLRDCPAEASNTRKVGSAVFDWGFGTTH